MEEQAELKEVYLAERVGYSTHVIFWKLFVEEKKKTFKVIRKFIYVGGGKFEEKQGGGVYLRMFYKKDEPCIFYGFENAKNWACMLMEEVISGSEGKLNLLREQKEKFES